MNRTAVTIPAETRLEDAAPVLQAAGISLEQRFWRGASIRPGADSRTPQARIRAARERAQGGKP